MESMLEELKQLTVDDIYNELLKRGENVGPIMPSMVHLYAKKLARRILKERGISSDEGNGDSEQTTQALPEIK